jgi:hypothetical protein
MVVMSNSRAAHVSCDGPPSSKMRVGAMRMYVSDIHGCVESMAHCLRRVPARNRTRSGA